jgi:hypothetical protein
VATSCPQIPFPPASTNLVYKPDAKNNMTLKSGKKCCQSSFNQSSFISYSKSLATVLSLNFPFFLTLGASSKICFSQVKITFNRQLYIQGTLQQTK